jgi:pyruvate/2-oxoglutarate dehydrogenase complex dihydrolipoamide dehydrogenase (E3) component
LQAVLIWSAGSTVDSRRSYKDFQNIYGNLVEGKNLSIENRIVPYAVFTDPQLAGVGITEKEARQKGYRLKIGEMPMSYAVRVNERDETAGS